MFGKASTWIIVLFFVVTIVTAQEEYVDYNNEPPKAELVISDFWRWLLDPDFDQHWANDGRPLKPHLRFGRSYDVPKNTRSPPIRLRYGRSFPQRSYFFDRFLDALIRERAYTPLQRYY